MHIVIMGCGRVGSTLARYLERREHSVAVIDTDEESFRRLGPEFSGQKVTGVGFDRDVMERADIRQAGAFAAVSSGDNSNILAARVARETFGINDVVARIYDPRRAAVYQKLGIPTVATVRWTADQVLRKLLPEGSEPEWRDPSGQIRMEVRPVPPVWVGQRAAALDDIGARLCFITRLGVGQAVHPDLVLQDGDDVHLAMPEQGATDILQAFAAGPKENH